MNSRVGNLITPLPIQVVSWTRWSVGPGGQRDQGHGIVLHDQGEEYQQPITSSSDLLVSHILVLSSIEPNQGKIPVLGLYIVERQV